MAKPEPGSSVDACLASQTRHATRVGYVRAFARPALLDAAVQRLTKAGCVTVFADECSGAFPHRPGLDNAVAILRPGDCLVIEGLESLSWRFEDLAEILADLFRRGVSVCALAEGLDTDAHSGPAVVLSALQAYFGNVRTARKAEHGRTDPRQKASISAVERVRERLEAGELDPAGAARELGVHRSTLYRRLGPLAS